MSALLQLKKKCNNEDSALIYRFGESKWHLKLSRCLKNQLMVNNLEWREMTSNLESEESCNLKVIDPRKQSSESISLGKS